MDFKLYFYFSTIMNAYNLSKGDSRSNCKIMSGVGETWHIIKVFLYKMDLYIHVSDVWVVGKERWGVWLPPPPKMLFWISP